jgi:hypothetical protein
MEIARENDISPDEAVKKFLSDIEFQYNNKLGFESKVDSLKSEVNRRRAEFQHTVCTDMKKDLRKPQTQLGLAAICPSNFYCRCICCIVKVRGIIK